MSSDSSSEIENILKDLAAGTIGGCAGILAGQPFDTIKVRLQSQPIDAYRNTFHCLRSTVVNEGFFSLYKGMLSPLVGNAPINAVVFGAYGNAMRLINDHFPNNVD